MKKILSMITLTVLMVALAGSCTKNIEERLDKTEADIVKIENAIGKYGDLQSDITAVIDALKKDVGSRPASEQQSVWTCINALQNQRSTFDAAIKALQKLVGEESVSVQIDAATAELISEYNLDNLASTLQELKEKVNAKYDITSIEKEVEKLKGRMDVISYAMLDMAEIEGMIQSVSIAPSYSDGSIEADEEGILTFKCIVSPAEALAGEKDLKGCFTLYPNVVEVLTKGKTSKPLPILSIQLLDRPQGVYEITADVTDYLPTSKKSALTVALDVKTSTSDFITRFVKVTAVVFEPDYVEIGGLWWATMNLGATTVAGSLATCAGDYYQWGSVETLYESIPWNEWPWSGDKTLTSWKTGKQNGFVDGSRGYTDDDATLPYANDVVKQKIGNGWRMPTEDDFLALYEACGGVGDSDTPKNLSTATPSKGIYWVSADQNHIAEYTGVAGCLFCDGTNKLFFPSAGYGNSTSLFNVGFSGTYWSSSLIITSTTDFASYLSFDSRLVDPQNFNFRYYGYSVRPVSDAE